MKKLIAILLLAALALTGCASITTTQPPTETETAQSGTQELSFEQGELRRLYGHNPFDYSAGSEGVAYVTEFAGSEYLQYTKLCYISLETAEKRPVCSLEGCAHAAPPCEAFMLTYSTSPWEVYPCDDKMIFIRTAAWTDPKDEEYFWFGENLGGISGYMVSSESINSEADFDVPEQPAAIIVANADGTNKRVVKSYDDAPPSGAGSVRINSLSVLSDGAYLYYSLREEQPDGAGVSSLVKLDLASGEVVSQTGSEGAPSKDGTLVGVYRGKLLYCGIPLKADGTPDPSGSGRQYKLIHYTQDPTSGEYETIYSYDVDMDTQMGDSGDLCLLNGELYTIDYDERAIMSYDPATGAKERVLAMQPEWARCGLSYLGGRYILGTGLADGAMLRYTSESIAGGDYAERTAIATDDEFGLLSASFDSMAGAVEQNVSELRESVREREDFVGAFTHEIKTPMTSMLGYAALLRKGESEPQQQRAAADYIWRETKRLEGLSQKLMILMGLKKEELALEPVSIKALFNALQKTLPEATHSVSVTFKNADSARVLADLVLLDDLVRNLIINAQRACADGGKVEVRCEARGGEALIYVKDDGCGIPADELAKITEPFYMVDKSRARAENGSGMGLALGARIAELHGARLEFQSEVGRGTTVSFSLPLAREEAEDE